jgi:hypothetical protein
MTAINKGETLADATFHTGTGIRASAAPKLIRALQLQANQLNSPNRSNSPHIDKSVATTRGNTLTSCAAMKRIMQEYTSATPAVARSKSSPNPGMPSGKIGKVDRSVSMVTPWSPLKG